MVTHDQEEALTMADRIVVMNNGEIEQVGTPEQIYRSPCNAFVANFIGSMNLLNIDILGNGRVLIAGAELFLNKPMTSAHSKGQLGFRPEAVKLIAPPALDDALVLQGILKERVFMGAFVRLRIAIEDLTIELDCSDESLPPLSIKQSVTLYIKHDDLHFYPDLKLQTNQVSQTQSITASATFNQVQGATL